MKKIALLLCMSVSVSAVVATGAVTDGKPVMRSSIVLPHAKTPTQFSVNIELVDHEGNPVTRYSLRGFWAQQLETGDYFYPTPIGHDQDPQTLFEDLPEGTYTFGSYPGNWDYTSYEVIDINAGTTDANGFRVVQLTYGVE